MQKEIKRIMKLSSPARLGALVDVAAGLCYLDEKRAFLEALNDYSDEIPSDWIVTFARIFASDEPAAERVPIEYKIAALSLDVTKERVRAIRFARYNLNERTLRRASLNARIGRGISFPAVKSFLEDERARLDEEIEFWASEVYRARKAFAGNLLKSEKIKPLLKSEFKAEFLSAKERKEGRGGRPRKK